MGDTEGRAPLISSTIRFASFLHFSPFYSPLAPLERLRLSLEGERRHATIGGKRRHSEESLPTVEANAIAYILRVSGEKQETPGAALHERPRKVRAGLGRRINT